MRDEGLVKKTSGPLAEVLVQSREACHSCVARAMCSVNEKKAAVLQVLNPVAAQPGDVVEIEVPETVYSRQFITMFGIFLLGALTGTGLGAWLAPGIGLSINAAAVLGFFLGLGISGFFNWVHFRKAKNKTLPVIISILTPGGIHG
ncbi:MAG: SoxR reducing system RseC family protein [Candidatus Aminicenantales bacterium]